MIAKLKKSRLTLFVAMLLLLLPWWIASGELRKERVRQAEGSESLLRSVRPGEFFGTVMAGGFRAVIIDYLWMRTKILERRKDYYGLQATYEMLARLQPRDEAILTFNANNMIYNIANDYNTPAMQYKWTRRGLALYRKGIEFSPDSIELRYELATNFFHKFSYQIITCSRDFRRHLRDDPDPTYLYYKDRRLRSPVREALHYVNEILSRSEARNRKDYINIQRFRMDCCDVLMFEREVGLREARLDVLEATEALISAGTNEEERGAALDLLKKRQDDLRAIQNGEVLAPLSESEREQLDRWRNESCEIVQGRKRRFRTGIKPLAERKAAVEEILRSTDEILYMYEKALSAQKPGEALKKAYIEEQIDALNFPETKNLIYGNSFYIVPLYEEAFVRLLRFVRFDETKGSDGN